MSEKTFTEKEVESMIAKAVQTTIKEMKKEEPPTKLGFLKTCILGAAEKINKNYSALEQEAESRRTRLLAEQEKEKATGELSKALDGIDPKKLIEIAEALKASKSA